MSFSERKVRQILTWQFICGFLLICILFGATLSSASADLTRNVNTEPLQHLVALPNTISVEMYQLNPSNGSNTGIPCSDAVEIRGEYGCTAIEDEPSFYYAHSNSVIDVNLEDYLLDVIAKEINPNIWYELAAVEAQAIASRSFVAWHENNQNALTTPFNNSARFQVFTPFAFEWLNFSISQDTSHKTCDSTGLGVGQQRACNAMVDKYYVAQSSSNPNHYPAKAVFSKDIYAETTDATYDKPYFVGVDDPISTACDANTEGNSYGFSTQGANRWARGHECSYTGASVEGNNQPGTDWSVQWDEAAQILTHYYTGIHIRDAANGNQQLTPNYRWNLLDVSWAEAGCPDVVPENGVCTGTFLIQNTGVTAWNANYTSFSYHSWDEQTQQRTTDELNRTTLSQDVPPGDDIEITFVLDAPTYVQAGERYQLQFDMWYWDMNDNNWASFDNAEAGRPWYTYDIESCVGYCRQSIYLPLVLKNWDGCVAQTEYWYPTGTNMCSPVASNCNEGDGQPDGIWTDPISVGYHQVTFPPQRILENTTVGAYWKTVSGVYGHLYIDAKIDGEWKRVRPLSLWQSQNEPGRWENTAINEETSYVGQYLTGLRFGFSYSKSGHQFEVDGYRVGHFGYCGD